MKAINELVSFSVFCFQEYHRTNDIEYKLRKQRIDEAIAELEALQEKIKELESPKECKEDCILICGTDEEKQEIFDGYGCSDRMDYCNHCTRNEWHNSDRYEPKDKQ